MIDRASNILELGKTGTSTTTLRPVGVYRSLALRLIHDLSAETERTVLFTEPSSAGLAGLTALWVARALATESNRPVLAVDATASVGVASELAGCEEAPGFADFVAAPDGAWESYVLQTDADLVSLLPAGKSDLRGRPFPEASVARFLAEAASRYGFVVLAGGSVLEDSLPMRLAPLVECVLLLARENTTLRGDLDAAEETIGLSKARRAGVVLVKGGQERKRARGLRQ